MIINLMAATMIGVGIYYLWECLQSAQYFWLVEPFMLFIVGTGLSVRAKWGAVAWYVFAGVTSCWWVATTVYLALTAWPYTDPIQTVISLIPGFSLLAFCVLGSVAVFRGFRVRPHHVP